MEGGYYLNPDLSITLTLIEGLIVNTGRYSYQSCPCRLASGDKTVDSDIICPCDYRDPDLEEFGSCYCGLYVSREQIENNLPFTPIPERRPPPGLRQPGKKHMSSGPSQLPVLSYTVWRCKVCGYLCARDKPPSICPICKATSERFECFIEKGQLSV